MAVRKVYRLINNERDCYDCDYTGNAEDLISPLNRLLTKTFLTKELLSKIDKELQYQPYQKFHFVMMFKPFRKGENIEDMYVTIEYDRNLTATSFVNYEQASSIIIRLVNEYLKELGYPVDSYNPNDFLDKLIEEHPDFEKYFEVETIE